ncbi:hypothetical protein L1D34_21840 [Vibrio mediterranei]|uniref:nitrilase-related carbon-nitrogen hydrolase n=1 Tax=Vibrio mediterranei TaxID=689 RepID=UPI001EFDC265|nr:nitrilase-related carbon-nitrogen hydrolase [Vibrio mediterranei]MCG9627479.1 hypothetical protein [Vibrio mediterranei]
MKLSKLFILLFSSYGLLNSLNASAVEVKVAALSAPSHYLNAKQSTSDLIQWMEKAHNKGVKILSTPEAFLGGYPLWNYVEKTIDISSGEKHKADFINGAIDLNGEEVKSIRRAAKKYDVAVVLGANLRGEDGDRNTVFNAIIFIDENGKIVNVHRKTSGSHTERQYWSYGEASTIKNVLMQGIQVSAVQCWEARNPLTVSQLALNAPDVVFLPTGDYFNEEYNGLYTVEMRYIGRNVHSYVLSSSIMFNWDSLDKSDSQLSDEWKKVMPPKAPMAGLGGGAAVDPHGVILDVTKPFETRLVTTVVDTNVVKGSLALHSITDSYRLKGDYTLYVDGKKITGNGVKSIY